MLFPELEQNDMSRLFTETFRGYNHNLKIEDGEWYDEMNLTADSFPVFSQRALRRVYASPTNPRGMIAKDSLIWIDGQYVYQNEYLTGLRVDPNTEKQIVSMGAYAVIFPDKVYLNTENNSDYGSIEASYSIDNANINYKVCRLDGTIINTNDVPVSPVPPEDPENGDYWIDSSDDSKHVLKQYSSATQMWASVPTVYIMIEATGIDQNFEEYDGVNISGAAVSDAYDEAIRQQIDAINGPQIIYGKGSNYIIIAGVLDKAATQTSGTLSVERKCPDFDYVTESNNRIWGCKYGYDSDAGQTVNELYACKLGDFRNWQCFMGLSTDSYTVSLGSDGKFTGAITHLGYPLFFKENCIHKIYGSQPSDFQLQTTICRGVQDGSAHSMCIVNETLIYKSRIDVCAFDGSLPVSISEPLGSETYTQAAAGATGAKYYISMHGSDGWHMFVYDISKGIWHHEDRTHAKQFATVRGQLLFIDADTSKIMSVNGIMSINGTEGETERPITWRADSGIMGYEYPDMKYISRFNIRARLSKNSRITLYIEYDSDGIWVESGSFNGTSLVRTVTLPVIPRRCDHLRLRLVGTGDIKIYSIARLLEVGSDVWD